MRHISQGGRVAMLTKCIKKTPSATQNTEGGRQVLKKNHPYAKCREGEGHGPSPPSNVPGHGGCVVTRASFLMFLGIPCWWVHPTCCSSCSAVLDPTGPPRQLSHYLSPDSLSWSESLCLASCSCTVLGVLVFSLSLVAVDSLLSVVWVRT